MKICSKCKALKPASDFHKNKGKSDGLQNICKVCAKERDALSYASNESRRRLIKLTRTRKTSSNRQFLSRYKRFIGCQNCGEKEPIVLDHHHDNPGGKEGDPSNLCSRSRKRLKEEVRKCIVLCANCHRKVHAGLLDIKK